MDNIIQLLNQISDIEAQLYLLQIQKQDEIDKIITPEIKADLDALDAEFSQKEEAAQENINILKNRAKELVLAHGKTVKGDFLQAVWSKGRTSWDKDLLNALARKNPMIKDAKKVGKPSVSFRRV